MRELATPVRPRAQPLVDIVGTGGDGANLFNVSSASAFVAAACGAHLAKHGNRGVSSSSGSADLLEQAGINLDLGADEVARCIDEVGIGFMFAPGYHGAMRHAIGARRALGMRTLFNILGPMTNPANASRVVIGVFSPKLCRPMAEVMQQLGGEHVMVVHANDGLDEFSLATQTQVVELQRGEIREYSVTPEDLGIESQSLIGLSVDSPAESLALIEQALGGSEQPVARKAAAMVALNAGAAVYVSGLAQTHRAGVEQALAAIRSGRAVEKMRQLAAFSQQLRKQSHA
jgi:anthranilate phosphoribosyltransferase